MKKRETPNVETPAIILDAKIAADYRTTWEANRIGMTKLPRHPETREKADRLLLLYSVEAATPLGRIHVRLILGEQVAEARALACELGIEHVSAQAGMEPGIAITTSQFMSLVNRWDGPICF